MQHARFVFQTARPDGVPLSRLGGAPVRWTLISANNRRLGNGRESHATYQECRAAVAYLQAGLARLSSANLVDERSGRVSWVLVLDDIAVAESSRSYLRARECSYNLGRFLESVPVAEVTDGIRVVRINGRAA
ncbi:hypothetical protein Afil01_05120 [Actinorhabdospora filicis]|uniref:DUF1508 domain-containing protein n=1 Tax=Actinorhabdospora filicis TaxID=1785913 RepID=A0A9W6SGR4_9ACTN|nr:hypothetical protein Afil01_05120 [Actinorhabdospora filicis]